MTFHDVFKGRKVLVTGHTGFKGSWLTQWLLELGAEVTGLALPPETDPNLFSLLGNKQYISHHEVDIRDAEAVHKVLAQAKPEIVIHMAAQPLVRLSYQEPKATWDVNVGGTVNLLESVRRVGGVRAFVVVTSDKCYENAEQVWGYRECDPMGGHDPYSSSKGATELAVASWRRSFFNEVSGTQLASARAGNVIGGGDWAADRIVVDFVKSVQLGKPIVLRNPGATRPWQHVMEPLSGYLNLAMHLYQNEGQAYAGGWNFGPSDESIVTVETLAKGLVEAWGQGEVAIDQLAHHPHEAGLLKLDCSKALARLGWHGVWDFHETVRHTAEWYWGFGQGSDPKAMTLSQMRSYLATAEGAHLPWTI